MADAKKGTVQEFKDFLTHGNLVEIAIAFVMGAAFTLVVGAVTGNDKNPGIVGGILGAIFGGKNPDFSAKGITLNGSFIPLGILVNTIINFVLVGIVAFIAVKAYNKMRRNQPPGGPSEIELLTEIRDSLKARS